MTPLLAAALLMIVEPQTDYAKRFWYHQCADHAHSCYGYIDGIVDTTRILAGKTGTKTICAPQDVPSEELARYLVELMNRPENIALQTSSFSGLVIAALESEYPCK